MPWEPLPERRNKSSSPSLHNISRTYAALGSDTATSCLLGYTELYWKGSKPEHLGQGDTAVVPAYRNRGIGRWLKAAALKGVLRQLPDIKYVRTGNATSNAAMLSINHEMGFELYRTSKSWQVERSKVEEYLAVGKAAFDTAPNCG